MTERDLAVLRSVWLRRGAALFALSQVSQAFPLVAACASRGGRARPVIWIPEYFCNEAVGLLRDGSADIVAYPLTTDLDPDWPACGQLAAARPPDVFVLVHYFGRASAAASARAFCDSHGARLVEDATHVMQPVKGIGDAGDFAFFGPRKFFDIPDGGLLIVADRRDADRVEAALASRPPGHPSPTRWRLKQWERTLRRRFRASDRKQKPLAKIRPNLEGPPASLFEEPNVSPFSLRRLARAVEAGAPAAIAQRRRLFEYWLAGLLASRKGVALVERHPDAVPCWFGVACANERIYMATLDWLRGQGIQALPWPNQLPPEALAGGRRRAVIALRNRYLIVVPPKGQP
jgi:hypothetical protein